MTLLPNEHAIIFFRGEEMTWCETKSKPPWRPAYRPKWCYRLSCKQPWLSHRPPSPSRNSHSRVLVRCLVRMHDCHILLQTSSSLGQVSLRFPGSSQGCFTTHDPRRCTLTPRYISGRRNQVRLSQGRSSLQPVQMIDANMLGSRSHPKATNTVSYAIAV